MLLSQVIIYITTVAATLHVVYISQWVELRRWLRAKACPPALPGRRGQSTVVINGVCLSRRQLLDACHTPAARLLLDGEGVLGKASMLLLHASLVNIVCLMSLLVSQVLVLQLAPMVLQGPLLPVYYPLTPELERGVCPAAEEPQFTGWMGSLVLALGQ